MKNAMDRMEEDEALNSSSRKDYTTQNEEAKWERTGASQKKNETKSTKPLVATRPCALIMSLCIIVRKRA